MLRYFLSGISETNARVTMFLFFSLLFLSVTFFVFADDTATGKNIFQDSDQDGLSNDEEALYKTDPLNKDTDGDGYMDGVEVESGYDPMKAAPGDKLSAGIDDRESAKTSGTETVNLTDQVSEEIANIVKDGSFDADGGEVTMEDINASVQNIMSQTDQEIVLPEVSADGIKIKKLSNKLKGDRRAEQEKEDAVEYLTVMAYILANNSPKKLHADTDLETMLVSMGNETVSALMLGNDKYIEDLSKKGEKILDEIKDVEVPEGMLDVHMKAMRMAKYSTELRSEVKSDKGGSDPIGQIASLSKVQGFLGIITSFSLEIYQKLNDLGIDEIPLKI